MDEISMNAEQLDPTLMEKETALKKCLRAYDSIAIAYSGGVDSTYLADVAHEVLGHAAYMILADSPSMPREELAEAKEIAEKQGWNLSIIATRKFENEEFLKNDGRRCYICKSELFTQMDAFARQHGVKALAYGEIADDALDLTRLGAKAAREHRVVAPLAEAGLGKDEIRQLSRRRGLPTWNKASFACLSSRFPTGARVEITEMLKIERAEQLLKKLGFRQYRARHHGDLCRIEIDPADFTKMIDTAVREEIVAGLRKIGYRHVTLDLAGYRTGSTAAPPSEPL